jgi:hypothetical protein
MGETQQWQRQQHVLHLQLFPLPRQLQFVLL